MAPQTSDQDQPSAGSASRSGRTAKGSGGAKSQEANATATQRQGEAAREQAAEPHEPEEDIASQLSFREAQTALELSLAELQAADLDVEQMAGLYRRANRYAERCEQLLQQVEQEVLQWDPRQPLDPPHPYQP